MTRPGAGGALMAKPHKMLAYLLEEKNMKSSGLWTVLPKSRVSEILNGKRGIIAVH